MVFSLFGFFFFLLSSEIFFVEALFFRFPCFLLPDVVVVGALFAFALFLRLLLEPPLEFSFCFFCLSSVFGDFALVIADYAGAFGCCVFFFLSPFCRCLCSFEFEFKF